MSRSFTCACVLALAGSASAQYCDDFDRPDGPIGGDWAAHLGSFGSFNIVANEGTCSSTLATTINTVASIPNYATSTYCLDVHTTGTGLQYVAMMVGLGGSRNLFIKVQQQTGDGFGFVGFYEGNNSNTGWALNAFLDLGIRFGAAKMTISFSDSDTVVLDFDTNFDGIPDHTEIRTGVTSLASSFGSQFGIGGYGDSVNRATWDNLEINGGCGGGCYPDCEDDGDLDVFDFLCFQGAFANGETYADCEGDGDLDVFDFLCFQGAFANGCN